MAKQKNEPSNATTSTTNEATTSGPAGGGPTSSSPVAGGPTSGSPVAGDPASGDAVTGAGTSVDSVAGSRASGDAVTGAGTSTSSVASGRATGAVTTGGAGDASRRYLRPTKSTNVFNNMVAFITRCGISILGSRVLYVRGRKTGEWRSVPVNLLTLDGQRYLVSPRGHSQWVRNLRATGHGDLRVGRRVERFVPTELGDDEKPAILRAYLRRWKFEVGVFFDGVDAKASDDVLRGIAPGYPVFRITTDPDAA